MAEIEPLEVSFDFEADCSTQASAKVSAAHLVPLESFRA
jgi:hypothetical protein